MSVLAFVVVVILVGCCSMTVNARKCYQWEFGANVNIQKMQIDCPANDQYCFTGSQGQYNGGSCGSNALLRPYFCAASNCTTVTALGIDPNPINVCCCDSDLCNSANSPISKLTATTTLMMLFVIVSAAFINAR